MQETASKPGVVVRNDGDAEKALASAARVVTAEYYLPHLAHAQMEPVNATARYDSGKVDVWAPLQSPGGTRDEIAKRLKLKPEDVTIHETLLGGVAHDGGAFDLRLEPFGVRHEPAVDGRPDVRNRDLSLVVNRRKEWTGKPSSVRLEAILRSAALDRWAGATMDLRRALASSSS